MITVSHRISAKVSHEAELVIEHTAAEASTQVRLTWAETPAPRFVADPQFIDFGVVTVGREGALSVTITNVGTAEASNIAAHLYSGDAASSFRLAEDSCTGATLQPQAQCVATVVFAPKTDGSHGCNLEISAGFKGLTLVSVSGQAQRGE